MPEHPEGDDNHHNACQSYRGPNVDRSLHDFLPHGHFHHGFGPGAVGRLIVVEAVPVLIGSSRPFIRA